MQLKLFQCAGRKRNVGPCSAGSAIAHNEVVSDEDRRDQFCLSLSGALDWRLEYTIVRMYVCTLVRTQRQGDGVLVQTTHAHAGPFD